MPTKIQANSENSTLLLQDLQEPSNSTAIQRTGEVQVTPMTLIERAAAQGAPVEMMAQLFDLKLRVEADEARKAYNAAMAEFKKNVPHIEKNKPVTFGKTEYRHTTLDHACDVLIPALSAVGIRHRWENSQVGDLITVTCVLSHDLGHSESTSLSANPDTSGSKNGIQAIGSTTTYLQRYTLLAACGVAAANTDDDGNGGGLDMPEDDHVSLMDGIKNAGDLEELGKLYRGALKVALEYGDKKSVTKFMDARAKRKGELQEGR